MVEPWLVIHLDQLTAELIGFMVCIATYVNRFIFACFIEFSKPIDIIFNLICAAQNNYLINKAYAESKE